MKTRLIFTSGALVGVLAGYIGKGSLTEQNKMGHVRGEIDIEHESSDKARGIAKDLFMKYGVPERGPGLRCYTNHALCYDQTSKNPIWVAEHLTADKLKGFAKRRGPLFYPDPTIKPVFSSQNKDFKNSGFSRGHMAPSGDNKHDQLAMDETFYLSNVVPQDVNNNYQFWYRLEMFCRGLTSTYSDVWVISGPLRLQNVDEDGKKFIKIQVIGENQVWVPTHLFKVILAEKGDGSPALLGSFIVPNKPVSFDHDLKEYEVDIETLEKKSGLTLLPNLDRSKVLNLCDVDGCELISEDQFEFQITLHKLKTARTMNRLDAVWRELEHMWIQPDEEMYRMYQERKHQLEKKKEKLAEEKRLKEEEKRIKEMEKKAKEEEEAKRLKDVEEKAKEEEELLKELEIKTKGEEDKGTKLLTEKCKEEQRLNNLEKKSEKEKKNEIEEMQLEIAETTLETEIEKKSEEVIADIKCMPDTETKNMADTEERSETNQKMNAEDKKTTKTSTETEAERTSKD